MKTSAVSLKFLCELVNGSIHGDESVQVSRVATLQTAQPGDISFLANSKYRKYLTETHASAVILSERDRTDCPTNAIVVADAYLAYAKIASYFAQCQIGRKTGIHPSAVIGGGVKIPASAYVGPLAVIEEGAIVGDRSIIGPGCVVGRGAKIGCDTELVARVTICHGVIVGDRVLIHPGAVIGADGFGLAKDGERWVKVPQLGTVVIGDEVEIGANTTVDRGALDNTILENGVKLDDQIHVAHNVIIGANTAIAAETGISGSTKIGKNCTIGGGVGFSGHLTIVDNVYITGMSMITKSILEPGVYSSGIPAEPNHTWRRNVVRFRHLEQMEQRLKALEAQLHQTMGEQNQPTS